MLNDFFDCIYVINLKRRPDRLKHIQSEFKKINSSFKLIEAIDGNTLSTNKNAGNGWNYKGVTGCAYSHKKVYCDALANNYNKILVVEDDNIFSEDFNLRFKNFIQQIPEDWDMLYFGGNHRAKNKPISVNVEKNTQTFTTNCYGIKTKHLPLLLKDLPEDTSKLTLPIDVLLTNVQQNFNSYSHKPKICWQLEDYSDIEQKQQPLPFLKTSSKKASLIISSFNQCKRLKFCILSALKQSYDNYEIIIADDNSTDNTLKMLRDSFPFITVSLNKKSKLKKYTLADNWNTAANLATGERFIFTNGDNLFSSNFISAHMDPLMEQDIIFGPNECTTQEIEDFLTTSKNHIELLKTIKTIERDLRHDDSAYTYNQKYNTWYPWGNNFSIPAKVFKEVSGFPSRDYYGGEEKELLDNVVSRFGTVIKSNVNAYTLHMWHPQHNNTKNKEREDYNL